MKDNCWYDYGSSVDVDRIKYGYDRAGNRIWRQNVVANSLSQPFDELYGYDGIHRLKAMSRGTLNSSHDTISSKSLAECWSLDATGNWQKYLEDTNEGELNLAQRIIKIVGRELPVQPYFDFQGRGFGRRQYCEEKCDCRGLTAMKKTTSGQVDASLLFGIKANPGVFISVTGEVGIRLKGTFSRSMGGCDNVDEYQSCLTLSGYGQFKLCIGKSWAIEGCIVVRVECNAASGCATTASQGDRCRLRLSTDVCGLSGIFCFEEEWGSIGFNLPGIDF